MIKVKVIYFAYLKEITGVREQYIEVDGKFVQDVLNKIFESYPVLANCPLMVVLNKKHVKEYDVVEDGDELRIYPPVSGG